MVTLAKVESTQLSFGEERDILCTISSVSTVTITLTSPVTLITDIYINCMIEIKACAGTPALNGKEFQIVDNTDDDIVICTDLSASLAAGDTFWIQRYSAAPPYTTAKPLTANWLGILSEGVNLPEPEYDSKEYRIIGGTRDWSIQTDGAVKCNGEIPFVIQNGKFLKPAFGRIYETGTDKASGGGSDLDGNVVAGVDTIILTDATDYATGDYIQIDTLTNSEIRKITNIATQTLTLDFGLDRAHADAIVCNEVEFPFTHVLEGASRLTPFTLEGVFEMSPDLILLYLGNIATKWEISGDEEGEVKAKYDIMASRPFKNTGTKNTVSEVSTAPYKFNDATFTFWDSVIARILKWNLSCEQNVDPRFYWRGNDNAAYASDRKEQDRVYTLNATVEIVDASVWDKLAARGELTLQVDFARATSDTFQLLCSKCKMLKAPHLMPEKGTIEVEEVFRPKTVKATFVDSVAPY